MSYRQVTKGQISGRGQMTWTRYKQGKLFKTKINDPTVQGCPKCLVLLAKIQERCIYIYMHLTNNI